MWETKLAESPEYTARRAELQEAEIELMRHRERVAELRRQLPEGAVVDDYVFSKARPAWTPRLSPVHRCG